MKQSAAHIIVKAPVSFGTGAFAACSSVSVASLLLLGCR